MKRRMNVLMAFMLSFGLLLGNVSVVWAAETKETEKVQVGEETGTFADASTEEEQAEPTEANATEMEEVTEPADDIVMENTELAAENAEISVEETGKADEPTETTTENTEVTTETAKSGIESTEETETEIEETEAEEEEETETLEETELKTAGIAEVKITDGNGATVKTISVSQDAASGGLQNAFDYIRDNAAESNIMTIKLPAGTYTAEKTLDIYSNTILDLSAGVTLKRGGTSSLIRFGRAADISNGYDGFKNISIIGSASSYGTLDGNGVSTSILRFAHAQNIKLQYLTFTNVTKAHHMEFAGSKNVLIDSCKFTGFSPVNCLDETNYEAVQIDILNEMHFGNYGNYDNTVSKDITITNNVFDSVNRGVGSHSGEVGRYFTNINISNNTFINVTGYAIVTTNYIGATITNNKINDCGAGIFFRHITPTKHYFAGDASAVTTDVNSVISGNTISIKKTGYDNSLYGIKVYGKKLDSDKVNSFKDEDTGENVKVTIPKGDYRVKNIAVTGNTVTAASTLCYGIWFQGVYDSTVSSNSIAYTGSAVNGDESDGVKLEESTGNSITGNTIEDKSKGIMRNGIYVKDKSDNSTIMDNIITKPGNNGIYVYDSEGCAVEKNTISDTGKHGIYVDKKAGTAANLTTVKDNTIKTAKNRGICINDSTYAEVSGNTINGTGDDGIYAGTNAVVSIDGNSITKAKNQGIYINSGARAEHITGNTITGSGQNGIYVNQKSAGGDILTNQIYDSGKHGIYINLSTAGSINENVIAKKSAKNSSVRGVCVNDAKASVNEIVSNKISNCSEHGIMVNASATVKNIENNAVKTVKKNGIYVNEKAKVTLVSENSVTGAKNIGIYINVDNKMTLRENTLSKCNIAIKVQSKKIGNLGKSKISSVSTSKGKLTLKWKKVKGAESYTVYRSTSKDGTYKKIGTTKNMKYTDKKVKKGTTYYYKVLPTVKSKKVVVEGNGTVKQAKATK